MSVQRNPRLGLGWNDPRLEAEWLAMKLSEVVIRVESGIANAADPARWIDRHIRAYYYFLDDRSVTTENWLFFDLLRARAGELDDREAP